MKNIEVKHILTLLLLFVLIVFAGCDNFLGPSQENSNKSVFADLTVGNTSYYVKFNGKTFVEVDTSFHYTGDTLIVRVIDNNANGYLISEKYTEGSTLMQEIRSGIIDSSYLVFTTNEFYVNVKNDSLEIVHFQDNNNYQWTILFGNISSDHQYHLPLAYITENKTKITEWRVTLPYNGNDVQLGYLENFSILNNSYFRANVYIDNSAMAHDGSGITFIYSKQAGIIRTYTINGFSGKVNGWDLLK